jgi:surface carbohydrate biosynthesis protein
MCFAVLRMLLSGKKSFFDYSIAYIKIFKPKFVFTFIDNNVDFYKIARYFPEIKFIAIQNGLRAKLCKSIWMWIF